MTLTSLFSSGTALFVPSSGGEIPDLGPYWIEPPNTPEFESGASGFFGSLPANRTEQTSRRLELPDSVACHSMGQASRCIEIVKCLAPTWGNWGRHLQKDSVVLEAWLALPFEPFVKLEGVDLHWWMPWFICTGFLEALLCSPGLTKSLMLPYFFLLNQACSLLTLSV